MSRTMRYAMLAVVLAACGDDGGPPMMVGGGIDAAIDAPAPCLAQMTYGTPAPLDEIATRDADMNPTEIFYDSSLNMDPLFDDLSIQLFKGLGTFEQGEITPRVVALSGAENNYETCGACVLIYVDLDPDNDFEDMGVYMVDGGTFNLMSVSPNIKGTISNANFVHVTIDPDTFRSTPVGDCTSRIDSFTFDFPVTTDDGMKLTASSKRRPAKRAR